MNSRLAICIFLLLVVADVEAAENQNSSSLSSCPRGTGYSNSRGDEDGCLQAPKGQANNLTLFQRPDFFSSYAAQSGQSYRTRPPWNVAGVDYPVGIPAGTVLKDLATSALPDGCEYSAKGNSLGGPLVKCEKSNIALNFEGFDWSGALVHPGHHGCVDFDPPPSPVSITFRKNYFALNSGCYGKSNAGYPVQIFTGDTTLVLENNVIDFGPERYGAGSGFVWISTGNGPITAKYNVWKNVPGDPIQGENPTGNLDIRFNYIENYVFDSLNQGHSEFIAQKGAGVHDHTYYEFNTILLGRIVGGGSNTSNIWITNSTPNGVFKDPQILNNTTVTNIGVGAPIGGASAGYLSGIYPNGAIFRDNYSDKTGANFYVVEQNSRCDNSVRWSGNFNLVAGNEVSKNSGFFDDGTNKGC